MGWQRFAADRVHCGLSRVIYRVIGTSSQVTDDDARGILSAVMQRMVGSQLAPLHDYLLPGTSQEAIHG